MSDPLVRNVPEAVVDDLKRRAAGNRRSLQAEILTILEEAVEEG
ncbi:MAG TPA: Arc family DNA-binding protein, partial [Chloroflexota bacterium]|nr:Arc family DNA-binding protein [Chloroflexota bacterium]